MPNWIPISLSQHKDSNFFSRKDYKFAAEQQVVPVLLPELPKILPHYPLAFIYLEKSYHLVVLTGLQSKQNLYVAQDGKWLAAYVPAFVRSHPFRLLSTENKQQVLCIQEDHLLDNTQGEPLFDQDGNLASTVQEALNFLNQCDKDRQLTQAACHDLGKAGVIQQWPLQIKQAEGQEPIKINGLYRVNEQVLNELDKDSFAGLRSHGAVGLAYAQLFSLHQVNQLMQRAMYHARQKAPDVDKLFAGEEDIISFDNI